MMYKAPLANTLVLITVKHPLNGLQLDRTAVSTNEADSVNIDCKRPQWLTDVSAVRSLQL